MKKVNGSLKQSHYEVIDYDTGEVVDLKPEYTTMSRRPGIAGDWFDKYKDDVYLIVTVVSLVSEVREKISCQRRSFHPKRSGPLCLR
jgi:hypothetical protein